MQKTYYSLAGLLLVAGLIICFENIMIPAAGYMIFFKSLSGPSMFWPSLIVFCLGGACGFFVGLGLMSKKKNTGMDGDGGYDYDI